MNVTIGQAQRKQVENLIAKFSRRFSKSRPTIEDWGRLICDMRRCVAHLKPHLLEELIADKDKPSDQHLLPLDYFRGKDGEDGFDGLSIKTIEHANCKREPLLKDEDLAPVAYAAAYVLAGRKAADMIPDFDGVFARHQEKAAARAKLTRKRSKK